MQTNQNGLLFISDFESFGTTSIWISHWFTSQGPLAICGVLLSLLCFLLPPTFLFVSKAEKISILNIFFQLFLSRSILVWASFIEHFPHQKYFSP